MITYTYALPRTERVWLLFSITLLVSATIYGLYCRTLRIADFSSKADLQGKPL
ncbi:hypothetical protein LCA12_004547 [Salmonella enterica]|nr:hypothetical protein [Salmonella enterica]ELX6091994.1 hypothetical protein [Salmonella enterica]